MKKLLVLLTLLLLSATNVPKDGYDKIWNCVNEELTYLNKLNGIPFYYILDAIPADQERISMATQEDFRTRVKIYKSDSGGNGYRGFCMLHARGREYSGAMCIPSKELTLGMVKQWVVELKIVKRECLKK